MNKKIGKRRRPARSIVSSVRPIERLEDRVLLAVPAAVTNVIAKAAPSNSTGVDLVWTDNSNNETGFRVERNVTLNEDANWWVPLDIVGPNVTTFSDTGLSAGQHASYRVIAVNADGDSLTSEGTVEPFRTYRATARTPHLLNTRYEGEDYQEAQGIHNGIYWQGWVDDGDWAMFSGVDTSNLAGFSVSIGTIRDGDTIELHADSPTGPTLGTLATTNSGSYFTWSLQSASATSLPGVHDVYFVYHGQGGIANVDWFILDGNASVKPTAATDVFAQAASNTSINVTWTDLAHFETGFRIERNSTPDENAGGWVTAGTVGPNVTSFTDIGLTSGTTYSYRVIAYNAVGDGGTSEKTIEPFRTYRATTRVAHAANGVIEAEAYQTSQGVHNGLTNVGWTDAGDWVMYSNVDLTGATKLFVQLATTQSGLHIEARVGSPSGTKIADLVTASTGNYTVYNSQSTTVSGASGVQDVYLVFVGGSGVANIDYLNFSTGGGASISGTVFNDPNSNGVQNGAEAGIAGWTLYLDSNNNNIKDAVEPSAVTDANGNYAFTGLAAGTYNVKQVLQSGYRKTNPGSGIPGYTLSLATGQAATAIDFGDTTNILLAGTVYNDANSNGIKDGGEVGIAGVVVDIISNNTVVATRTTDANGFWQVRGLSAGSGQAKITLPGGYTATGPIGGVYVGSMISGQQNANLNFGLHTAGPAPAPVATGGIVSGHYEGLNFFGDESAA